jgi:transposase
VGSAVGLRGDYDWTALRRLAQTSKSANQARRLLALAEIYDGASRTTAARIGGVGLQIVRDWVERFNDCGPDGLLDGKATGRRSLLNDAHNRESLRYPMRCEQMQNVDLNEILRCSKWVQWLTAPGVKARDYFCPE